MATRSAAANRTDTRAVTGRVHVWKRCRVTVSEATNNLSSWLWVQSGMNHSCCSTTGSSLCDILYENMQLKSLHLQAKERQRELNCCR